MENWELLFEKKLTQTEIRRHFVRVPHGNVGMLVDINELGFNGAWSMDLPVILDPVGGGVGQHRVFTLTHEAGSTCLRGEVWKQYAHNEGLVLKDVVGFFGRIVEPNLAVPEPNLMVRVLRRHALNLTPPPSPPPPGWDLLFSKRLTASDLRKLSLPRVAGETLLPQPDNPYVELQDGIDINHPAWRMRVCYNPSSASFYLGAGWSRYRIAKNLQVGHRLTVFERVHNNVDQYRVEFRPQVGG